MTDLLTLADLSDDELRRVYDPPRHPWLRMVFVSSADGSAAGADGLSGSISNEADQRVFRTLRELADGIVVGAGTVRDEGYEPNEKPIAVVTRSGRVPETLQRGDLSQVFLVTVSDADHLGEARSLLGDRVLECGVGDPDLAQALDLLRERGLRDLVCEGGPGLAGDLWEAGLVDELALTVVPRVVGGDQPRIAVGPELDVALTLATVVDAGDALLLRYVVERDA